jgi:outer membrane protein OmpA-like peptidoglycan-associated protein
LGLLTRGSSGDSRADAPGGGKSDARDAKQAPDQQVRQDKPKAADVTSPQTDPSAQRLEITAKESMRNAAQAERAIERDTRISGAAVEGLSTGGDKLYHAQFHRLEQTLQSSVGGQLYNNDQIKLTIVASASRIGDERNNVALSQRRAENFAQQLRDNGFTGQIEISAKGSSTTNEKNPNSDNSYNRYVAVAAQQLTDNSSQNSVAASTNAKRNRSPAQTARNPPVSRQASVAG